MYIFSILLVPGWHLECPHGPHHLFFQNLPVQKVRYSKQKVCQNYLYIYIYIHSCLFIETHCWQEFLRIIYIYLYLYIYLSIYLSICVYVWMQVSYIENLQGLPKAPAKQDSEALKSAKKEANTVEDSADDMWWTLFLVSAAILQTQGKQKTQKTQETHIIHTYNIIFLRTYVLQYADADVFLSTRFWRSRRSRMISRVWVRSAGWVCAQFILEFSYSPVSMDRTDTVYVPCFVWFLAST